LNKKGIYLFECLVNNKVYIGSSANLKRRFKTHIAIHNAELRSNFNMKKDMLNYGLENFGFGILEYLETSNREDLYKLEQVYLDKLFEGDKDLIYNISMDAQDSIKTYNAVKLKDRDLSGPKNGMYGRRKELHPKFGVKPTNSIRVGLYDDEDNLIQEYKTKKEAYTEFNKDGKTLDRKIEHGTLFNVDGQLCYLKVLANPNNIPSSKSIGRGKMPINVYDINNKL